mmetsp:Transcript_81391/g.209532  ORF Transcript_81391/g.209532 Transcript_81391/m.209532 type:complete len:203 (+) Transcript_81391:378-986(+)
MTRSRDKSSRSSGCLRHPWMTTTSKTYARTASRTTSSRTSGRSAPTKRMRRWTRSCASSTGPRACTAMATARGDEKRREVLRGSAQPHRAATSAPPSPWRSSWPSRQLRRGGCATVFMAADLAPPDGRLLLTWRCLPHSQGRWGMTPSCRRCPGTTSCNTPLAWAARTRTRSARSQGRPPPRSQSAWHTAETSLAARRFESM